MWKRLLRTGGGLACSQPSRLAASSPYSLLKFEIKALFRFTWSLQAAGTSLPKDEAIVHTFVRSSRDYAKTSEKQVNHAQAAAAQM